METLKKRTLCLLAVALLLTACKAESATFSTLSRQLGIQIPNGQILAEQDSHGGFHGDGETFIKIKFSEEEAESLTSEMKSSPGWHMLPLTENLSTILYGYESDVFSCSPMACDDNGNLLIPAISNGYWFFMDRHPESTDPSDDSDIFSRYSYNFTLAVYDMDQRILYYFKMDT